MYVCVRLCVCASVYQMCLAKLFLHYRVCLLHTNDQVTRHGRISLRIPVQAPTRERALLRRVIALDPGVCTFMTGYDLHGLGIFWGEEDRKRLMRYAYEYDRLLGEIEEDSSTSGKLQALHKLRCRARNVVKETHRKLAKFLCTNYDIILCPILGVARMVARDEEGKRSLRKETVREMLSWRHHEFRLFLKQHARQYPGVTVIFVGESHTSKTCGPCGDANSRPTREFQCKQCGFHSSRDLNGARYVMLSYYRAKIVFHYVSMSGKWCSAENTVAATVVVVRRNVLLRYLTLACPSVCQELLATVLANGEHPQQRGAPQDPPEGLVARASRSFS